MGTVIRFPLERRLSRQSIGASGAGASIVILPVIRIERHGEPVPGDRASLRTLRSAGESDECPTPLRRP